MLSGIVLDDSKTGKIKRDFFFRAFVIELSFPYNAIPFQFLTTSNSLVTTRKTCLRAQ